MAETLKTGGAVLEEGDFFKSNLLRMNPLFPPITESLFPLRQEQFDPGGATQKDIEDIIEDVAFEENFDPDLARAVGMVESGLRFFDKKGKILKSKRGALGIFQLLPSTAKDVGANPRDLRGNIVGGIRYLKFLMEKFQGNPSLFLAAYNAGPGNVRKFGGVPPFKETKNFISRVMKERDRLRELRRGIQ